MLCQSRAMRMLLPLLIGAGPALAEPPEVIAAEATQGATGWQVAVTLAHPDTGWDHYADGWRLELADGTVLGTRDLLHPHVAEQPFTRMLAGVAIPDGVTEIRIRARCNVDGWSGGTFALALP